MNILILIDVYSKFPMGGAGTVLLETAKTFRAAGHSVLVLCRRRRDIGDYEFIEGVPFWTFNAEEEGLRGAARLWGAYRKNCQAALAGRRWDVILCHHPLPLWSVGRELPQAIPVVSLFHSPWPEEYRLMQGDGASGMGCFLRTWIEREALARSDRIVTLSRYMGDDAARRYPACAGKIDVVPGGVNLERFSFQVDPLAARAGLGLPWDPGGFWVLTIRRHVPRTGIDSLLAAVARIAPDAPDLRLVVGGTGPLEPAYRRQAETLGIADRVHFTGFLPTERLPGFYGAADLFVLPSRNLEGFGLSTVEAMATGTPALVTPVGGAPEVVAPFDGRLVAAGWDEAAIAHALLAWHARRDALRKMRSACRRYAEERFSWDMMRAGLEKTFAAVL